MLKLTILIFLMAAFFIGHNVVSSNEDDEKSESTEYRNAACKGDKIPSNTRSEDSPKCSDQDLGVCTTKSEDWEVVEIDGCDPKDPEERGDFTYYFYCTETTNSHEVNHGERDCIITGMGDNEKCTVGNAYSTSSKHTTCADEEWGIN